MPTMNTHKQKLLEEIKQSVKEMKAMKAGKMKAITWEEMLHFIGNNTTNSAPSL